MDKNNYEQPTTSPEDDEIDLNELFEKIWIRRKFIIALAFIALAVAIGIQAMFVIIEPPENRYSAIIQFNFPGAEKGLYPSGRRFSYNDIVSAKVLEIVYQQNNLKAQDLSFKGFISSISINPFAENSAFIKQKYQIALGAKNLTPPEIKALETTFLNELDASQSRFVRLSMMGSALGGLDSITIQKILLDIPKVWSRQAIEEYGALNLKVAGADFYQADIISRYEFLQTMEYLERSAENLATALETLIKDEIGGSVRIADTGVTAFDLKIQLSNLRNFQISPLFSTMINFGITKDPGKAIIYLQNTLQNYSDDKSVLVQRASNIENIINQYSGLDGNNPAVQQEGGAGGFSQFDSSFLDKFTALIEEKNDKGYLQEILNTRLGVLQAIEEIEGNMIRFRRAEERLKSGTAVSDVVREDVIKDISTARDDFENMMRQYRELLAVRNSQALGDSASLYQLTSGDVLVDSSLRARLKRIILISILVSAVAFMLATLIALIKRKPGEV